MGVEPRSEGPVRFAEGQDAFRVLDHCLDFEAVADDARVREELRAAARVELRHLLERESVERFPECLALAENRQPRETGLIDLERQPLEQLIVVMQGEAVLPIVIRPMIRMIDGDIAVSWQARG